MKAIIGIICTLFFIFSCKKDKVKPDDFGKKCEQKFTLDSLSTAKLLIGSWKWKGHYSQNKKNPKINEADKNVIITFTEDGNFTVVEESKNVDSGIFKLKKYSYRNIWQLELTEYSKIYEFNRYFYGMIIFCENQLSFDNTPTDGSKNLFERVK